MEGRESKDLTLAPNEHAFVQDMTKGLVNVYAGPNKASLSQTDQPVRFDDKLKRFVACTLSQAKSNNMVAPENWYIALKNPALNESKPHPVPGTSDGMTELKVGHKVNIPGPTSFALWPGQMARLIKGHTIDENQYLLIRVYNEEAAKNNINKMVLAPQGDTDSDAAKLATDDLVNGKLMVVKGTDVSFYMPPTGIEVVRTKGQRHVDSTDHSEDLYVRNAVTLERLEYCLLLDKSGSKRYVYGPDVVFPEPTEEFVENNGSKKSRAIELNKKSGIYIKVIAPYNDDGSPVEDPNEADHKVGEELFITGDEQAIYYPREEHAILTYGKHKHQRHFGIAIPKGEARYVLHREKGDIRLEKGPSVFLPDPRHEVVVRRILPEKVCVLLYPGNQEALDYNIRLAQSQKQVKDENQAMLMGHVAPAAITIAESYDDSELGFDATEVQTYALAASASGSLESTPRTRGRTRSASPVFKGNQFTRGSKYTPPRTLTLDTKYDGAVTIMVKEGYAVMLTNKSGGRRVIQGPQTALLEYDENPHFLSLSTGKPKTTTRLKETAYLKIRNNPVSDIIEAETKDFCNVSIKLTYRVNFVGDPEKWFSVENYVKLLCHNMRSIVRNFAKKHTVEEFYQNSATLLRDLILGESNENRERPGRLFEENGMKIHDVEILEVNLDNRIQSMLIDEQHAAITQALAISKTRRDLSFTRENEDLKRQIAEERSKTEELGQLLRRKLVEEQSKTDLTSVETEANVKKTREELNLDLQEVLNATAENKRTRLAADYNLEANRQKQMDDLEVAKMNADAEATAKKASAISPGLIAALQGIADADLAVKVSEALGATQMLHTLGGESVADAVGRMLKGSAVGERLEGSLNRNRNREDYR